VVGGAADAGISRRLRAAQASALREHRIDPSRVPIGRTFTIGHHHRIIRVVSLSSTTRQIFSFSQLPSWYQKISIRSNTRNDLLLAQRAVKTSKCPNL
jgi:hypothetical protein